MAHDVFLSHSAKDKSVADAICARMESDGIRCWVAPRDILPGAEWGDAIMSAIGECPIMVLVLSNNSNGSPQVRREVERAIHRGVMVIPFRIEEMKPTGSMEYFLSAPHWLDAIQPPLEPHIAKLTETAKALLGPATTEDQELEVKEPATDATPLSLLGDLTSSPPSSRRGLLVGVALAGVAVIAILAALLGPDGEEPPPPAPLVISDPAHDAVDVPLDIGLIRLTFNRAMATESWTVWESEEGRFPELSGEIVDPWRGDRVFEFAIEPLEPHTTYALQLNSTSTQNFCYATDDEPLPITTLVFRTGSG